MTNAERDSLRAAILRAHGSVYQFCRRTGLNRSLVGQVLRGVYPGNADLQAARIQGVLEGRRLAPREEATFQAIKAVACSRCSRSGKTCARCDDLFKAQARAVTAPPESPSPDNQVNKPATQGKDK